MRKADESFPSSDQAMDFLKSLPDQQNAHKGEANDWSRPKKGFAPLSDSVILTPIIATQKKAGPGTSLDGNVEEQLLPSRKKRKRNPMIMNRENLVNCCKLLFLDFRAAAKRIEITLKTQGHDQTINLLDNQLSRFGKGKNLPSETQKKYLQKLFPCLEKMACDAGIPIVKADKLYDPIIERIIERKRPQ